MRDRINALVKNREAFRPFAPSVLEEQASTHFDMDHPSRFMTETFQVVSHIALPAITHVDGTARVQTVDKVSNRRFADLLMAFYRCTGCPILLNTSFNVRGEPIVCSPIDAIVSFSRSGIDLLVLEDLVLHRSSLRPSCQILFGGMASAASAAVGHRTYTLL
jgi:carbamoyltransferase